MKGLFIPLVLTAAVIGLITAGPTTAQESIGTRDGIEKNDDIRVDQNLTVRPLESNADVKPVQTCRNAPVFLQLVSYLSYTSARLTEDIRFEMKGFDDFKLLIGDAEALNRNAENLHIAIAKGADLETIEQTYDAVAIGFRRLDHRLQRYNRMRLVDDSLFRFGRMLASFDRALAFGDIVGGETPRISKPNDRLPNFQPAAPGTGNMPSSPKPVEPQLPPSKPDQPAAQPKDKKLPPMPTIPEDMKDISLLPQSEQATALAQRTCPVTGDLLGSFGKPLKVRVKGRTIFVCCDDCVKSMKKNPEKYLKPKQN